MVASIVFLALMLTTAMLMTALGASTAWMRRRRIIMDDPDPLYPEPKSTVEPHPASPIRSHPARPDMRGVSLKLDLVEVDAQIDQAIRELEAAEHQLQQRQLRQRR